MVVNLGFIDLDKIADSGQCFRWEKTGSGSYVIPSGRNTLIVRQAAPDTIEADCSPEEWKRYWATYFDAGTDYEAIVKSIDPSDSYLTAAAEAAHGIRILKQEPWETIASFIISQNNNIPRIKASIQKLCAVFGHFPSASDIILCSPKVLSKLGLGYRDEYLWKAAMEYIDEEPSFLDGWFEPDRQRHGTTYEEERAYFLTYKGIGEKVADCICLYGYGHKEAFPMDVWMKRIVVQHYRGSFPVEKYQPYAGVMQQFMFYYERQCKA
jgi:N-glycosylase/DNA lyase